MSSIDDVERSAALEARSRPLAPASLPGPVACALGATAGPELALETAAVHALARRSIIPSAPVTELDLPAASQTPVIPDDLGELLSRMLTLNGQDELITRALRLIRRRGLRLPPILLSRVACRVPSGSRALVVDLMDARARAVFAMDEDWAGLVHDAGGFAAVPDPARWESSSGRERAGYLARVRAHDPAAGRALLEDGTWLEVKDSERERILAALATGLGPQDEPLLETCLDDRAEGVRRVSADLLCRLPSSAFIGRVEALARTHVVVTRRLLRAPRVELLPVVPTDELTRDQYTAEGHLASAALDVVSRVPIHRWRSLIGLSATELLEADVRYEGRPADLSEALTRAALRWEDARLARALVDRTTPPGSVRLLGLFDTSHLDAYIDRLVTAGRHLDVAATCEAWPLTLSPRHSLLAAHCIVAVAASTRTEASRSALSALSAVLPGRCAPEAVDQVLVTLETAPAEALEADEVRSTIVALELRRELLELTDQEAP